ncbi:MAG: hypothetical protein KAU90_03655, partial [Sulfurovaceae bacterium]|nr:hypothetical protein [Sulfurovaceae bacterium]
MKILKFIVTTAIIFMLFSGCTQVVKRDKEYQDVGLKRPTIDEYTLNKIADQIYKNETGGNPKYLMYWSPSENFASLGYGHFIWYPANQPVIFDQTFPDMIQYYIDNKVKLPQWLKEQKDKGLPWANRKAFNRAKGTPKYEQLKTVLINTKAL